MADIPCIVCIEGPLEGQRFDVPEDRPLRIGRAADNDLVIPDEDVSRYHAELLYDIGTLWLRDAGSRNGVFVNGARLTQHKALKVDQEFRLAGHCFVVRWKEEEPLAEEEPAEQSSDAPSGRRRWWPFS